MIVNGAMSAWALLSMGPTVLAEAASAGVGIFAWNDSRSRKVLTGASAYDDRLVEKYARLSNENDPFNCPSLQNVLEFSGRLARVPLDQYAGIVVRAAYFEEKGPWSGSISRFSETARRYLDEISSKIVHELYQIAAYAKDMKLAHGAISQLITEVAERYDGLAANLLQLASVTPERFSGRHLIELRRTIITFPRRANPGVPIFEEELGASLQSVHDAIDRYAAKNPRIYAEEAEEAVKRWEKGDLIFGDRIFYLEGMDISHRRRFFINELYCYAIKMVERRERVSHLAKAALTQLIQEAVKGDILAAERVLDTAARNPYIFTVRHRLTIKDRGDIDSGDDVVSYLRKVEGAIDEKVRLDAKIRQEALAVAPVHSGVTISS